MELEVCDEGNNVYTQLASLLLWSAAAQPAWVGIDYQHEGDAFYVNTSNVKRAGDKVYYWSMITYSKPRLIDGKWSMSELNEAVTDCAAMQQAFLYLSRYDKPGGEGNITDFKLSPESKLEFRPIAPQSLADHERKIVCNLPVKAQ